MKTLFPLVVSGICIALILVAMFSGFIFFFTLLGGGLPSNGNPEDYTCKEVNINMERLPPIQAACWFWQEV